MRRNKCRQSDESGDPNFNDQASDIFFLGAVIIEKSESEFSLEKLHGIKNSYGIGELKSSKIGGFERRLKILQELSAIKIQCISVWVKKRELRGDWFQYKKTFYKYIQKLLNHEVYRLFRNATITIDRYGSENYRQSLLKYLQEHLQGELFDPSVSISSAVNNDFIQVADFFSGTIRKVLNGDFNEAQKNQVLSIIEPLWKVKVVLPDQGKYVNAHLLLDDDKYLGYFVQETKRFLEGNNKIDTVKRKTLEYLYHIALVSPNDYVYTDEILDWLANSNIHYSQEQFRNKVIASLRDDGIIIIGSRKGLKLPTSVEDIFDYINFSVSQALPILKRMRKAITTASAHPDVPNLAESLSDEMRAILQKVNV